MNSEQQSMSVDPEGDELRFYDRARERYDGMLAERGWTDGKTPEARLLWALALRAEQARDLALGKLEALSGLIDDVRDKAARPVPSLNSLGELGSSPGTVEAAIGELGARSDMLARFLREYPPLPPEQEQGQPPVQSQGRG